MGFSAELSKDFHDNSEAFLVKKIYQVDNHTFAIEWGDKVVKHYRLNHLQKACPCASCELLENEQKKDVVKEDVRAHHITSVGRYALRIQFTSGCSLGIFSFGFLRERVFHE